MHSTLSLHRFFVILVQLNGVVSFVSTKVDELWYINNVAKLQVSATTNLQRVSCVLAS
jgi:hypothetical protein